MVMGPPTTSESNKLLMLAQGASLKTPLPQSQNTVYNQLNRSPSCKANTSPPFNVQVYRDQSALCSSGLSQPNTEAFEYVTLQALPNCIPTSAPASLANKNLRWKKVFGNIWTDGNSPLLDLWESTDLAIQD